MAWTRLLTLQMGHTVAAASTVLAAFMGGLALGASAAARVRVTTSSGRLRAYALLELAVAAAAVLLPILLATTIPTLRWAYADGDAPLRFGIVRFALSLTLIGIPAIAMGATFPLAAAWLTALRGSQAPGPQAAGDVGALYAANTAGAAIGAVAAGFLLIPALGLRATTFVAVALNAFAAAGALWLATRDKTINAEAAEPAEINKHEKQPDSSRARRPQNVQQLPSSPQAALACAAAAVSGFVALVYEVAWTRLLALVIGPTTYAFTTMVVSFIAGLAIGSAAGTHIARRSALPARWLAAMVALAGAGASVAAWFAASRLPLIVAAQVAEPGASFGPIVARQAVAVALLLLPATFALGAAFPLALAVASVGARTAARDAARVYAANTLGAIAGAIVAGFALLPALGLQGTFRAASIVAVATSAGVLFAARRATVPGAVAVRTSRGPALLQTSIAAAAVLVAAAATVAMLPAWDRELLASGAYKYAPYVRSGDLDAMLRAGRLEYYTEGAGATVSVRRLAGTLSMSIDGKVDASNGGDMLTQRLLGLLPVLLHRRAEDICIIGLGSGVTVASALAAGTVRRADVVEISPAVVEAAAFFERENGRALASPAVHLIVGDGRSHLLLTKRQYDVIVSEPSNPWMAGVAALFTREFFLAARARLNEGGLLCQWAHTYDIRADDLRSIVRTFASVFPQATMWMVGEGDLLLIGTRGPAIEPYLEGLGERCRTADVRAALSDVAIEGEAAPFAVLSLYAGGPHDLQRFGGSARIETDDRMALEFSAPRAIYGRSDANNADAIRKLAEAGGRPPAVQAALDGATAAGWASRGAMELKAEAFAAAYDAFGRSVTLDSSNAAALRGLSDAAAGCGRETDERSSLQTLVATQPRNAAARVELSRLLASDGELDAAAAAATDAMRIAPDDPRPGEQLASILADAGDAERLGPLADALVAKFPSRADARYFAAAALFLKGRPADAADQARRIVAAHPQHAKAHSLLGAACASSGQRDCAREAFEASLRANPRDPTTYVNAGVLRLQSGDPAGASAYFAEALTLDPDSAAARQGLAGARAALAKP